MSKPKLDTYLSLCTQVYDLSKPHPPEDALAFYRSYVAAARGPVLEPMCGTGRFLLPLLEEGFEVQGFDASENMLSALREKSQARLLKPHVWLNFVEELEREEKYHLIFIPSGSFGLILDLDKAKAALSKFYSILDDEGIFLFEAGTLKAAPTQTGNWNGSVYNKADGSLIIANFLDLPIENNIISTICKYELVENSSISRSEIENFKVRLYDPKQMMEILNEAGFKHVKMIKNFAMGSLDCDEDDVIVYECRKSR